MMNLEKFVQTHLKPVTPESAPSGELRRRYHESFEASAIEKAKDVLQDLKEREHTIDLSRCAYFSIGGSTGAEVDYVLRNSIIQYGLLLEKDNVVCNEARRRAHELERAGKHLEVYTGDAIEGLTDCRNYLRDRINKREIDGVVCSVHALLHELATRSKNFDLRRFIAGITWDWKPLLFYCREPCAPMDWPNDVILKVRDLSGETLKILAEHVRAHLGYESKVFECGPDAISVSRDLALDVLFKTFYWHDFQYELGERASSIRGRELVSVVFQELGADAVVEHAYIQSRSFVRLYKEHGVTARNPSTGADLALPACFVKVVASRLEPAASRKAPVRKRDKAVKAPQQFEDSEPILQSFNAREVRKEDIPQRFGEAAEEYQELREAVSSSSLNDLVDSTTMQRVLAALEAGRILETEDELKACIQREKTAAEAAAHRRRAHLMAAAEATATLGDLCAFRTDYASAAKCYADAIGLLSSKQKQIRARYLNRLGVVMIRTGKHGQARDAITKAMNIQEDVLGAEHPDVALSLNNLALLAIEEETFSEAKSLLKRSLSIREARLGANHPEVAQTLNNLAGVHDQLGYFDYAQQLYDRALRIREAALAPDDPRVAITLDNLARCYRHQLRYNEAMQLYDRALAIWKENTSEEKSENTIHYAISLSGLAGVLYETGQHDKATTVYLDALSRVDKVIGSPATQVLLHLLLDFARMYMDQHTYVAAEPLYRRALALLERTSGPFDLRLAPVLINLAVACGETERLDEAESLLKRAVALLADGSPTDQPALAAALLNLAKATFQQGKYDDAEQYYVRALPLLESLRGPADLELAQSLNRLGLIKCRQGDLTAGELCFKKALTIRKTVLGETHLQVSQTSYNLAVLYHQRDKYEDAIDQYEEACRIRERILGPDDLAMCQPLIGLGRCYLSADKPKEGKPFLQRALPLTEVLVGKDHPEVGNILHDLGLITVLEGNYSNAIDFLERAFAIRRKSATPNNVESLLITLATSLTLAGAFVGAKRYPDAERQYESTLRWLERQCGSSDSILLGLLGQYEVFLRQLDREDEARLLKQWADRIHKQGEGTP